MQQLDDYFAALGERMRAEPYPSEFFFRLADRVAHLGSYLRWMDVVAGCADEPEVGCMPFSYVDPLLILSESYPESMLLEILKGDEYRLAPIQGAVTPQRIRREIIMRGLHDQLLQTQENAFPPIYEDSPVRFNNHTGTSYVQLLRKCGRELLQLRDGFDGPEVPDSEIHAAVESELSRWDGIEHLRSPKTRPVEALTMAAITEIHRERRRCELLRTTRPQKSSEREPGDAAANTHQQIQWSQPLKTAELLLLWNVEDLRTVRKQCPVESLRSGPTKGYWQIAIEHVPLSVRKAYMKQSGRSTPDDDSAR